MLHKWNWWVFLYQISKMYHFISTRIFSWDGLILLHKYLLISYYVVGIQLSTRNDDKWDTAPAFGELILLRFRYIAYVMNIFSLIQMPEIKCLLLKYSAQWIEKLVCTSGFPVKGVFQCNRTLLGPSTFVLVSWCVDCFWLCVCAYVYNWIFWSAGGTMAVKNSYKLFHFVK